MLPVPRPEVFIIGAWEQFDSDARLKDAAAANAVSDLLAALADWTLHLQRGHADGT
jgi:hypothetical protein